MTLVELQINDKNIYHYKCRNGHENVMMHQNYKFQILFESGLGAIHSGYYREGVSSIVASLERFFEICINIFYYNSDIDNSILESNWKNVSNQSER